MTKEIWRLSSLGLGIEGTPGTYTAPTVWIPTADFNIVHDVAKSQDDNALGIIDNISGSAVQKESSVASFSGIARSQTLGYLLKMALGTAGTATLVETGVYSHALSRLNTNTHPSASIVMNKGNSDEAAPYHMIESFDLEATVGEYVNFKAVTKGGKIASQSVSPSFLTGTSDEQFISASAVVKVANDIAGLSGASSIPVQNIKFSISKKLLPVFAVGSTALSSQVNQDFGVTGDFEIVYDSNTYRDLFTANTKQAIQIVITGSTLIGATKYNQITIQIAQAQLSKWERKITNDGLVSEMIGFIGEYNVANTQTMNVSLQNTKSTSY